MLQASDLAGDPAIVAARIQADSAIEAARIGAHAAYTAALVQGVATFAAGMLALLAGYLAYRAATGQVRLQKATADKAEDLLQLNLILKVDHMAYSLIERSQLANIAATLVFCPIDPDGTLRPRTIPAAVCAVPRPAQLDELWDALSSFPGDVIFEIRRITRHFDEAEDYLKGLTAVPDNDRSPLPKLYQEIVESAVVIRELLSVPIAARSTEFEDRNRLIYGDPVDG